MSTTQQPTNYRKVILYIAMSLDGYIATNDDDLSFLELVQQDGEDYGYEQFVKQIDTVIIGRKTYDWVTQHVTFPHTDKQTYVITKQTKTGDDNLIFYNGSLRELIAELKQKEGKHIYCDGGATLVNALLQEKLIDDMIISIIPVVLGGGKRLFKEGLPMQQLHLLYSRNFKSGLVQVHYQVQHLVG